MLLPALEARLGIKFDSLIAHTVDEIAGREIKKVGLLASPTTIRTKLYEKPLQVKSIEVILPSQAEIAQTEQAIRGVIGGAKPSTFRAAIEDIASGFERRGAEAVLLGCTELSVIFSGCKSGYIDPMDTMVNTLFKGEKFIMEETIGNKLDDRTARQVLSALGISVGDDPRPVTEIAAPYAMQLTPEALQTIASTSLGQARF